MSSLEHRVTLLQTALESPLQVADLIIPSLPSLEQLSEDLEDDEIPYPEMVEDYEDIDYLAGVGQDLNEIRQAVIKRGQVSIVEAQQIHTVHPQALPKQCMVKSYTQHPSLTNYHATVEGLGSSIASIAKAIYDTITKMIDKVVTFIKALFGKGEKGIASAKEATKQVIEQDKTFVEQLGKTGDFTLTAEGKRLYESLVSHYNTLLHRLAFSQNDAIEQSVKVLGRCAGELVKAGQTFSDLAAKGADEDKVKVTAADALKSQDALVSLMVKSDLVTKQEMADHAPDFVGYSKVLSLYNTQLKALKDKPATWPFSKEDDLSELKLVLVSDKQLSDVDKVNDELNKATGELERLKRGLKDIAKAARADNLVDGKVLNKIKNQLSATVTSVGKQSAIHGLVVETLTRHNEKVFLLSEQRLKSIKSTKVV